MTDKNFVPLRTDKYFTKSKNIVEKYGDAEVTYAVFQRRDVIVAAKLAVDLINEFAPNARVIQHYPDGTIIPAKTKVLSITGKMSELVELETLYLQRLGVAQVAAYNAYAQATALPNVSFLDMHGRHATGDDMMIAAAYGASIGSKTAKFVGAKGFIGTSNDLTAHFYNTEKGMGTMPHAIIGYAASHMKNGIDQISDSDIERVATLEATKMYIAANPEDKNVTALVDYFGHEISDSILIAKWFYGKGGPAEQGKTLSVRLDTHGGRFLEGLNYEKSVEIVCKWLGVYPVEEYAAVRKILGNDVYDAAGNQYIDEVRKLLFAQGVSAAAVMHTRRQLNKAGFPQVKIVASSGFDVQKCKIMAKVNAPIDVVGTGSFLPKTLSETYATSDIIVYNGVKSVKVGREWLFD